MRTEFVVLITLAVILFAAVLANFLILSFAS